MQAGTQQIHYHYTSDIASLYVSTFNLLSTVGLLATLAICLWLRYGG